MTTSRSVTSKSLTEVRCSDCGNLADIAWVHPTSPDTATPYCGRCARDNESTEQDIASFEMSNFGGYYGVPSHTDYPLSMFKWYIREDGRFQATFDVTDMELKAVSQHGVTSNPQGRLKP
jgi:hypothetical protein